MVKVFQPVQARARQDDEMTLPPMFARAFA